MPKIIGIIAAVVLAIAAFVAWKNQGAYKKELENLQAEQFEKKTTTEELKTEQKRLQDAEDAKNNYATKLVETGKKLAGAINELDELNKEVEELKTTHAAKEEQIENAKKVLAGLPSADDLIPKLKRLKAQLVEAEAGIADEKVRLAELTRKENDGKAKIASLEQINTYHNQQESFASLNTSISAVYRGWGFVILAAGDNEGVVSGSTLDVMRNGEVIGKLKVTAVEQGRAAADIIIDSLNHGIELQAGDAVVAERDPAAQTDDALSSLAP